MFYNQCEQKISICSGNSQLVPKKKKKYILNETTHPQVMQILVAFWYYFPGIQYFKLLVMSNDKEL